MNIIKEIQDGWGWAGIVPVEIVGENDFGNLIIKDAKNKFWRLCPEDLYCEVIAQDRQGFDELSIDQKFLEDWYMKPLVEQAKEALGPLPEGCKYCLTMPGPLGGEYAISNIKIVPLAELIGLSGDIAEQIKDLPEGAQIQLKVK